MNDMIQIIISVALGFAAGFGFKEIISKPKSKAGVDSRKSASAHKATFLQTDDDNTFKLILSTERKPHSRL